MSRTYKTGLLITGDARGGVRAVQMTAKELDKLGTAGMKVGEKLKSVGENLKSVGRTMSTRVTVPITAAGVGILKSAGDFEAAMNRVVAVSGASGDEFAALTDQAKELGRTTKFSASEAADAMGFLAMAGNNAEQILSAMPATLQLAAAAGVDLGAAADTVTNILAGFKLETEELTRANDVLISAMTGSNTDLQQLGEALKYVGPVAAGFGLTLEETTAALGLLGNAGIQASMAGTTLRGMLTRLADPSKEAATILENLGIAAFNADGSMKPLADILGQIEESGMSSAEAMSVFGQRAGPGVLAMVGQGTGALVELRTRLENAGGTAQRISEVQMQGLNGAMKSLTSALEGLGLAIAGSGILEFATGIVTKMTDWVRVLAETNPEILNLGVMVAGAAAAIGPLALVLGGVVTALGALISPIGLVVAAVVGLGAAWIAFGDDIQAVWTQYDLFVGRIVARVSEMATKVVKSVTDMVARIKEQLVGQFARIGDAVGDTVDSVVGFFADMWDKVVGHSYVPDLIEGIEEEFDRLDDVMVSPAEEATSAVTGFFEGMGRDIAGIIKGVIKGTTDLGDALKSLGEQYLDRFIDRGIDNLLGGRGFFDYTSGGGIGGAIGHGTRVGGGTAGGGGSGGLVGTGTLLRIGKEIGTAMGNGQGLWRAVATGIKNGITGISSTAAGNLGFKGPGVMNYGQAPAASTAASSGAASAGAVPSWAGGAVMAVVSFMAGLQEKSQMKKIIRAREEMMANFSPLDAESLGLDSTFIGALETAREGVERIYAAVDRKLVIALKEAGAITGDIGLRMAMNGEHIHQMHGSVEKVRQALEGAKITGFAFAGSIETAIEKGNGLQVSIEGNSEIIKQALVSAAQQGDLAFRQFTETASGASAVLTGDIGKWQKVLQDFVTTAVKAAIAGVDDLAGEANNATTAFERLARAAASVPSVRANPFGGRDGADGSHAGGLPYVPFDGYRAVLHQGERVLTRRENLRYAAPQKPVDIRPLLAEVQALKDAVLASGSSVRQGVDETTRQVKKQVRGYSRRIA